MSPQSESPRVANDPSSSQAQRGIRTVADAMRDGLAPRAAHQLAVRCAEAVAAHHVRGDVHGALTPRAFEALPGGEVRLIESPPKEPTIYRLRYAAPEVLQSQPPTTATDVYSLALIVRELIEGMPARRTSGEELSLDAVEGRVSAPHGLHGELQGVCTMALHLDQSERPGASHLVAALNGGLARRKLSSTDWVVGAIAVAVLAGLALVLRTSSEAQQRSEEERVIGREFVEGFVTQTYAELERMDQVAPLIGAGKRALESLEGLTEEELTVADQAFYAETLLWNAKARQVVGEDAASEDLFRRALERSELVADRSQRSKIELRSRIELAGFARDRGDSEDARSLLRGIVDLELSEDLETEVDRELLLIQARAQLELGDLIISTSPVGAASPRGLFNGARSSIDLLENGGGEEVKRELLELRLQLDRVEANQAFLVGDDRRGRSLLTRHVDLAASLVAMDPSTPRRRQLHARGADILGRARARGLETEASIEAFRIAVASWFTLRQMEPSKVAWKREWARSSIRLASGLASEGKWQEATEIQDAALTELAQMLEDGELARNTSLETAGQALGSCELLLWAGELVRARQRFSQVGKLLTRVPPGQGVAEQLDVLRVRQGALGAELLLAEGRWNAAIEATESSMAALERLAIEGRDAAVRSELARLLLVSAAVRAMENDRDKASELRRRALEIGQELQREDPGQPPVLSLLARTHFALAEDEAAAEILGELDDLGYRGVELSAVRAACAVLRSSQ